MKRLIPLYKSWVKNRNDSIKKAIKLCLKLDISIPAEWVEEYNKSNERVPNDKYKVVFDEAHGYVPPLFVKIPPPPHKMGWT